MKIPHKFLQIIGQSKYLRFGLRDRIIRFFHNPGKIINSPFITIFFGYRYKGNYDSFIDWHIFYYGAYAVKELKLIKDISSLLSHHTFIDIGANVGNHSLFASKYYDQILAFEPVDYLAKQFEQNYLNNDISNVKIFSYALGEKNEDKDFYGSSDYNFGTGSLVKGYREENQRKIKVKVRAGDSFFAELKLPSIDFIKIDVEGYEIQVLKGLTNTLIKYRPVVFFEWSNLDFSGTENCWNALFPPSYVYFEFDERNPILFFFESTKYKLTPVNMPSKSNNYLAIPIELADKVLSILS